MVYIVARQLSIYDLSLAYPGFGDKVGTGSWGSMVRALVGPGGKPASYATICS